MQANRMGLGRIFATAAFGLAVLGGVVSMPSPTPAQDIDVNSILRCTADDPGGQLVCAEGRELILYNCTTCHSFGPIVLQQFDEGGWRGLLARHRERVAQLTDAQVDTIRTYLTANFNDTMDPPEVPAALLEAWTDY
jgi:mono/diheme cytochrome c family protein